MIIHTVKNGENLYSIARRYSVPSTKILGDNELYADRLIAGDELVIHIPTKTQTVKGKDTVDMLASKFGVRRESVFCANPSLMGRDKLRPGQVITIKQDAPTLGAASALAQINKGCRHDNLTRALPYSTYITINSAVIDDANLRMTFDPSFAAELCRHEKKIHLLGVKDISDGGFLCDKASYANLIDELIKTAKTLAFGGIFISSDKNSAKLPNEFCEFLLEARKRFIGCDLLLFTDIFEGTPTDASEISDGAVYNISSLPIDDVKSKLKVFSDKAESSKVFINIPDKISLFDKEISVKDAKELCYRGGFSLELDKKSKLSSFNYTRYKVGRGESQKIEFPSISYIRELFLILSELGFNGIAFDCDMSAISVLSMFSASFARADYTLPFKL